MQITKPFTVPKIVIKGDSRSLAMSSFSTSPGHSIRDWKSRIHIFSDKNN